MDMLSRSWIHDSILVGRVLMKSLQPVLSSRIQIERSSIHHHSYLNILATIVWNEWYANMF